jgi:hypothetical protein
LLNSAKGSSYIQVLHLLSSTTPTQHSKLFSKIVARNLGDFLLMNDFMAMFDFFIIITIPLKA